MNFREKIKNKSAAMHLEMSPKLHKMVADNLGEDVANVLHSILRWGDKKAERLISGVGENRLMKYEEFFRNLKAANPGNRDVKNIHDLLLTALNTLHQQTPMTPEDFPPMSEDIKGIKAKMELRKKALTEMSKKKKIIANPVMLQSRPVYSDGTEIKVGDIVTIIDNSRMQHEEIEAKVIKILGEGENGAISVQPKEKMYQLVPVFPEDIIDHRSPIYAKRKKRK